MKWSSLRRLVWNPDEKWAFDPLFIVVAIFVGSMVGHARDSTLLGFLAMFPIVAVREVLYHYLVRRKRPAGDVPPNQRL